MSSWRSGVLLIIGAIVLTYWNSLTVPFHFDDFSAVENEGVRQSATPNIVPSPQAGVVVAGRPVVRASFAANYALGGLDARGYHILNIAVHVLCALLLYAIVRQTLSRWSDGELQRSATIVALCATLIWALHPLNTGAVTYISARSESLMAMWYLGMLLAGIRAHDSERQAAWYFVAVASCALGMATKESMVTAPIILVLFDRGMVFTSFKETFTARWRLYAALAATWGVLVALAWSAPRAESVGLSLGVSPWTYLLNQAEIITDYLRRSFWPSRLVFAYGEPRALTLIEVLPQALLIVLLVGLAFWAWRVQPKIGFLAIGFFVVLAPTSTFIPIATEVGAERRMYLPLAALSVLGVVLCRLAWLRFQRGAPYASSPGLRFTAAAAVTVLCVSLGALTMYRNAEYASAEVLWQTALERWPSAMAHRNLATSLRQVGRREEAIAHLRATFTDHPEARYIVGVELSEMGRFDESIAELQHFLDTAAVPGSDTEANARFAVGLALAKTGRSGEAAQELTGLLTNRPDYADAHLALADVQLERKQFTDAVQSYRRYLALAPRHVGAWTNLGVAAISAGQIEAGINALQRAVELEPKSASARVNLASALADSGRFNEAIQHAEQATRLAPENPKARELYDRLLLTLGQQKGSGYR